MRPDEHKKKRSAQYKRKHNIAGKNCSTKGEQRSNESADGIKRDEEQSDDIRSAEFSRRKVISNWEKYEEPIVSSDSSDEERGITGSTKTGQKCRGADFATLVKNTADPSSQFRFQSENEWEETDAKSQPASSFLEINIAMLGKSVQSLPLYRRLDLDVENIHPDMLERFNKSAGIAGENADVQKLSTAKSSHFNSELVPSQHQDKGTKKMIASSKFDEEAKYKKLVFAKPEMNEVDNLQKCDATLSVQRNVTAKQTLLSTQLQASLKDIGYRGSSMHSTSETRLECKAVDEDELEQLLSLDTLKGPSNQSVSSCRHKESKINSTKMHVEEPSNISTDQQHKPSKPCETKIDLSKAATSQDELEDWLDSVLG